MLTPPLALQDSARARIAEVVRALQTKIPEITSAWRTRMFEEFHFDGRIMAALERLNIGTGFGLFCGGDFNTFFESLNYFGMRLAKLHVDTRVIARSLELYQQFCEAHLEGLSPMARAEGIAGLESFNSMTFVAVSGAYHDAQRTSSAALLSVLDAELSSSNLNTLLDKILRVTMETFHASLGLVLLRDNDDFLRPRAVVGLDLDSVLAVPVGVGFTGQIAESGEPGILPDVEHGHGVLNPLLRERAKALWGMPLRNNDQVIGVLMIGFAKPFEWLPSEKELLGAIAERSALAIEKARFHDTLREREMRIAELSGYLLRAQEEERTRISRELHDATGQQLMVIRLYLGMLESGTANPAPELRKKIVETIDVVDQTIEGIRRIIAKLSPLVLEELGLIPAIRKEAKDFSKRTGVRSRVAVSDGVGRLSNQTEMAVYRVVQEALHNVAKHAQAKNVTIQIDRNADLIAMVIQDDGVGISKGPVLGRNFGLSGMTERVAMLGGAAKVVSAKNKGTRIEVRVPVTQRSPEERGHNRELHGFMVKGAAALGRDVH